MHDETLEPSEVTRLLHQLGGSDDRAVYDRLMPLVYRELRRLADSCLARERAGHTLQPTALVNEAFLKLAGQPDRGWKNRGQFLAIAATAMRRILVDHARERNSLRRGGDRKREPLDSEITAAQSDDVDVIALDDAMTKLAEIDPRKVRIVELRYFVGLTLEETSTAVELSLASVKREWNTARAWLKREIDRGE